jgi:OFA family oxalate/formate antiporter-like MFS transporter
MRRYSILLASVVIQITLGGIYAWSVFVPPLQKNYGLSQTETGLVYGLNLCFFTIALVLGGRLMERLGPRLVTAAGGVLFAAGWLGAGCSGGSMVVMTLCLGPVLGAGIAFGYVCLLATCVKWFPHHKGLVAGLTMAGFGAGAVVLSQLADFYLRRGTDVLEFFRVLGLAGGTLVFLAALVIDAPKGQAPGGPSHLVSFGALVRQRRFWSLVAGLMAGTFGGQLVVGNLKSIGLWQGLSDQWATLPIAAFAAGSGAGRIAWGWLHDRLGRGTVPASLLLQGAAILFLLKSGADGPVFCVAAALVGLAYGANFVLYAAEVARFFGVYSVSRAYPWVFIFYAISGTLGPLSGGWMYEAGHAFTGAMLLAAGAAGVGAAVHWALRDRPVRA